MSKSVLVIDTPEDCMQCSFFTCLYECAAQDKDANYDARTFNELIQTCPLRSLPEKKNMTAPASNHEVQKKLICGRLEHLH